MKTAAQEWMEGANVSARALAAKSGIDRTTFNRATRGKASMSLDEAFRVVMASMILAPGRAPLKLGDLPLNMRLL